MVPPGHKLLDRHLYCHLDILIDSVQSYKQLQCKTRGIPSDKMFLTAALHKTIAWDLWQIVCSVIPIERTSGKSDRHTERLHDVNSGAGWRVEQDGISCIMYNKKINLYSNNGEIS